MVLGSTQPLTEISTRNLSGAKGWPECKADNLTAICEQLPTRCGSHDVSQPYGPSRPLTGMALFLFYKDNEIGPVKVSCEYGNECSGSIKCWEVLE
jgi:hypothetical protein